MKHKSTLSISLVIFLTLVLTLISSYFIISSRNLESSSQDIKEYITFTTDIYDGTNADETISSIKNINKNIKVTFINLDGTVIKTNDKFALDSYLETPEILKLGTVQKQYSDNLKTNVLYIAKTDNNIYIHLSIPLNSNSGVFGNLALMALIIFIFILPFSLMLAERGNIKSLLPLNGVVSKLSYLATDKPYSGGDNIEDIANQIKDINIHIYQKIEDLTEEKEKVDFVINNMNRGIVVIDSQGNIVLLNDYASSIFKYAKEGVIDKNYLYLIRNLIIQEKIDKTINTGISFNEDIRLDSKVYSISISKLNNQWTLKDKSKNGVVVLAQDITDAKNIENMKREFFANASHELKSPLTTIIGYQQMIIEGIINNPDEINDATKRTHKEAQRMNNILGEMLELSKLESKKEVPMENINISTVVSEIIESNRKEMEDKKVTIKTDLERLEILFNGNHLYQLVNNLIDNAIKYNIVGGTISIKINALKKELVIEDSGIGISKENQSRVFERFYRVDKGRSKEVGGTGLGLAIVKHVCSIYEAKVLLNSEINVGTTIKIKFK